MKLNYRKAYLTDETQVKITEELYQKLKQWEWEGYHIPCQYSDMLKKEDNEMINATRNYYIHNISLDEQLLREHINPALLHDKGYSLEEHLVNKDRNRLIMRVLELCTETQKRRFLKHYYLGFSYAEIALQEHCSRQSVHESIATAEKQLVKNI